MNNGMLIYADIQPGRPPKIFMPYWGKSAYEHYQVPHYLNEIKRIKETDYLCWTPGFVYLALAIEALAETSQTVVVEELGSSIFSSIDKFEKIKQDLALQTDFRNIDFLGIEIMPMMLWLAEQLHPGYRVRHIPKLEEESLLVPHEISVSRCYQSSSYVFDSSRELANWVSKAKFSIQGVFFSRDGGNKTVDVFGNRFTIFDIQEFCSEMSRRGCQLIPLASSNLDYDTTINCNEVFFISHRMTEIEFSDFLSLCKKHQIELPQTEGMGEVDFQTLLRAPSIRTRGSSFFSVKAKKSIEPTDGLIGDGFDIALNFYDEKIKTSFINNFDLSKLSQADICSMPILSALTLPFQYVAGNCYTYTLPSGCGQGDAGDDNCRSQLVLLEDGIPLAERHVPHSEIQKQGKGKYSHWGTTLYFSTSDNSDPNLNGRKYEIRRLQLS